MNVMSDPTAAGRGGVVAARAWRWRDCGYADEAMAYAGKTKSQQLRAMRSRRSPRRRPQSFVQRWSTWAMGYGGSQTTDGNAVAGDQHLIEQHLRRGGGRGLSCLVGYGRGLRAVGWRYELSAW